MLWLWPFASSLMLVWAVAAVVPILLHLWNRRQRFETDWAAMRFLLAAAKKRTRRVRLEQWLLMALRMLIVLLFVAAAAEPYLPGFLVAAPAPAGRTHRIVVLDGSFSMKAASAGTLAPGGVS